MNVSLTEPSRAEGGGLKREEGRNTPPAPED